jgi:hypothetical protein
MDTNSVTNAINSYGVEAFGISMPILAQDWVDGGSGSNTPSVDDTSEPMKITLSSGNWAAPCTAALQVIDPTKGQSLPVTLLNSAGQSQFPASGSTTTTPPAGVLLTLFETAWLRLNWLYAKVLEGGSTGQPVRQVPRYFFYPGQTSSQTMGMADAGAGLGFGGDLWIFDNDGLPIDPVAVVAAFNALMTKQLLLQADTPSDTPQIGNWLTTLASTTETRIRVVNPDGTPNIGAASLLQTVTAVSGAPAIGLFTATSGTAITIQTTTGTSGGSSTPIVTQVLLGASTNGTLGVSFTPPKPTSGITLQRDFLTLRLVDLNGYLLGAGNARDPAAGVTPPIPVRMNESLTLLASGNDVIGAVGAALASGASPTLAVAQALDGTFALPSASGAKAAWPSFPTGTPTSTDTSLPLAFSPALTVSAIFATPSDPTVKKADVAVSISGFPTSSPNLVGAWARVYSRKFGLDAVAQRGDGAGGPIQSGGKITLYLTDPLGLAPPGTLASSISLPPNATLNFDMVVALPNATTPVTRIYGGMSCAITQTGGITAPDFSTGTNPSTTATVQGVSNAGILGLGKPSSGAPPTSFLGWVKLLTGEGTPRDASRLPTMARRELLAAGLSSSKWNAVISGGRIAREAICAQPRLGEPGGFGGRETTMAGVSTSGGPLAYDIARHALRRGQNIISRVGTLAGSSWNEPVALTASGAGTGTFAGALLQNISPYCETPELQPLLANVTLAQGIAAVVASGNLVSDGVSSLSSLIGVGTDINDALNSLASNLNQPLSGAPMRIADEIIREMSASTYGRRDSQWALASAIGAARHFIYIETPGFCSTMDNTPPPAPSGGATPPPWPPTYAQDLIAMLQARITALPGLRVIICVPKYADFAPGYEQLAADEVLDRYNIIVGQPGATPAIPNQLLTSQTVSFHPIGFPGRYARVESQVVIVDDCWALVGGSSFRRRGFAFDGSSDLVLADTALVNGRSAAIRDFRRGLMAARLGIPADQENPSYVLLNDGAKSFDLVRSTLQSGGLGYIDLLWNGQTPGVTPVQVTQGTNPSPIDLSNPDGRNFSLATATIAAALAASSSGA